MKRPRAPSSPDLNISPDQELDERNGLPKQPSVPPGFLSPSVKEYLELGKSIPGTNRTDLFMNYWYYVLKTVSAGQFSPLTCSFFR